MKMVHKRVLSRVSRDFALAAVAGVFASGAAAIAVASSPAQNSYTWAFATTNNPVSPSSSTGQGGTVVANIATGKFSQGWLSGNTAFGAASGIWDLGQNGTITLGASSGFAGAGNPAATLSVKVVQWSDGGIFSTFASVSVPNATLTGTNLITITDISPPDGIGVWIEEETLWNVNQGASVNAIVISSANPDSVIDSVSVQSSAVVPVPPPLLSIVPVGVGSQLKISWPTNYGTMDLQSNGDVNSSSNWSPVGMSPQTDSGGNYVIVDATNAMRFYRLKQP